MEPTSSSGPDPAGDLVRAAAPAAVTVRSGVAECLHHGVASVVTLDTTGHGTARGTAAGAGAVTTADERAGAVLASLGDDSLVTLPRSALKLIHAVSFLELGLDIDDELLAIVCASHSGEPEHLHAARRLLEHAGLDESALRNTPDLPLDAQAAFSWRTLGGEASPITQNCSGNHAGMLAASVAAGWPTDGYTEAEHPVQRAIAATTTRLAGWVDPHTAVDGCGAPAFATTVRGLARAYAALAAAPEGSAEARVLRAVRAHPWLVGGSGRRNTRLMRALPGVAVKDGADGVIAAAMLSPDGAGIGVAVKVLDGADRARGVVLAEGLRRAGLRVDPDVPGVTDEVLGHGRRVGEVVALPWD